MLQRNIVVIGASAGGVEALSTLVKGLPADLPASLFVAVHFPPSGISILPDILNRAGPLRALHPADGATIQLGRIYVAPPDHHLQFTPSGQIRLSRGPRENGHRPAIDPLFRSAARIYGQRVIGIILTGTMDDGAVGLLMVQKLGGVAIVQDPDEAMFDGMPRSAIATTTVDHILPLAEIAAVLSTLVHTVFEEEEESTIVSDNAALGTKLNTEGEIVARNKAALERGEHPDAPSPITCPDCGGVLWELRDNDLIRFRCHVGHAYSSESLLMLQADDVEKGLWSAVRALEEKAALCRRMAHQAGLQNRPKSEALFLERAQDAKDHADIVRQVVMQQQITSNKMQN